MPGVVLGPDDEDFGRLVAVDADNVAFVACG